MKEKYILSTKTYEDWRNSLLVNSFFFHIFLRHIRKQMGIPSIGLESIQEIFSWERKQFELFNSKLNRRGKGGNKSGTRKIREHFEFEDKAKQHIYQYIWEILERFNNLDLNFEMVRLLVLGHTNLSFPGSSRVQIVTSPKNSIRETGVYIKFSPDISNREIIQLKKQALRGYQTLLHVTGQKQNLREKKKTIPTKQQLKIYTAVESHLIEFYSSKPWSFVINRVFEEVAHLLHMSHGTVRRIYYTTINNFNLPSTPELNKIPRE